MPHRIAATIICFHPDMARVSGLVRAIEPEVAVIIIRNNGGADSAALAALHEKVEVVGGDGNLGIATPLNQAFARAVALGCRFIVSFDQDSTPPLGMVSALARTLEDAQRADGRCIAIGPTLVDERGGAAREIPFPALAHASARERGFDAAAAVDVLPVSHVITSGCLVDLSRWCEALHFMDALFIDLVDTQWCWNAAAQGFVVLGARRVRMAHELSDGIIRTRAASLNRYSPVRRYYQVRNAVYLALRGGLSGAQRLYLAKGVVLGGASAVLTDTNRLRAAWFCLRGAVDALRSRLGPFSS